ncbi:hypothetical protein KDI_23550 [Dictyobacter arantiisoli]|uniref:Uncharacterized protein n=1 Tax=Dictyobacter arantiisoli TaxID=2014874 RepID=A0A5A5TBD7_9CHLR|nr:hypothetical protein KDI_23550 [Dictyobacter arantiisoli]
MEKQKTNVLSLLKEERGERRKKQDRPVQICLVLLKGRIANYKLETPEETQGHGYRQIEEMNPTETAQLSQYQEERKNDQHISASSQQRALKSSWKTIGKNPERSAIKNVTPMAIAKATKSYGT